MLMGSEILENGNFQQRCCFATELMATMTVGVELGL